MRSCQKDMEIGVNTQAPDGYIERYNIEFACRKMLGGRIDDRGNVSQDYKANE